MVERKCGFGVVVKVAHKTSDLVSMAIVEGLQPFADRVKMLTYDNGKKFAAHIQIDSIALATLPDPLQVGSGEWGFNDNLNSLLHQYAPKKRSMNTVKKEEMTMIQNRLNNRTREAQNNPRKSES